MNMARVNAKACKKLALKCNTHLKFMHSYIEGSRQERCISSMILRVSNKNGVSLLYVMLEIHHSGREPSYYIAEIHHSGQKPSICCLLDKRKSHLFRDRVEVLCCSSSARKERKA